ncbi:MAG TPA: 2-hydroxyacyl-CoA dehydratase, partial [Candidatus Wallbacteria bacterium]|nr:2-hydroxyacyl-CoA dehydratase [Candidatus Wallbacteria bacterium]
MISISDYPDLKIKLKSITGISSTLPIEVLYAAGRTVVDLNNIFITSKDSATISKSSDYVPRTVCSWTRGILESAIALKLPECVIVTEGDCAHTIPIMEVLEANGVKSVPFEFPIGHEKKKLKAEIARLMNCYGVSAEECLAVKEKFDITRKLLNEIDELTYKDLKVNGFENHLYLISASDFLSDPDKFHKNVEFFLREARSRHPKNLSIKVGYAGIPTIFTDLHDFIDGLGSGVVYNETARQFSLIPGVGMDLVDAYHQYTYPYTFSERLRDIKKAVKERELDCIIHYVQSFCFHQIEDRILKDELGDFPVLTLEGDHPSPLGGSEKLKIESFLSSVEKRKRPFSKTGRRKAFSGKNVFAGRHCAGIDIGSRSVKIFFSNDGNPSFKIFDTMDFILRYMGDDGALKFAAEVLGVKLSDASGAKYFSTGYGRYKAKIFDAAPYPELQCHAAGAVNQAAGQPLHRDKAHIRRP